MNVEDGEESKQVNLTFIRNAGDAGTVSIEVQKEGYHLQADINMVVMEQSYSGQGTDGTTGRDTAQAAVTRGNIYFAGSVPEGALEKADSFKAALKEAGINADNINISAGTRPEDTYISYLANQKAQAEERREKTEEKNGKIDALYMAAKSFLSFF